MGERDVKDHFELQELRRFTRNLIRDVQALEQMLERGMFDDETRRIGAEQEMFLVDDRWQPAPVAEDILARSTNPRLVNELTRFNLELNLDPAVFTGSCLADLESNLLELIAFVRHLAEEVGAEVVLTGILPTIHLSDLGIENMAPQPRYFALNEALNKRRGGPAHFQMRGTDELFFKHDTILVEGCNTSFQTHFQVSPDEFGRLYNIAQVIAGPVLAASSNSPILFGKRLWRETRIALFQQAVDTRSSNLYLREMSPRVHFGTGFVDSILDIYKEDIARFRVLLAADTEDSFEVLDRGEIPKLKALQLHNGTVYRWTRPCYGITDGRPHLRIENRILPAGPSIVDEVANAAFWFGLMNGMKDTIEDVRDLIDFDDAKSNFVAAARLGLSSQLAWFNDKRYPSQELICDHLLPVARDGLEAADIDQKDIDKYLTIIDKRVKSKRTGSQWILESLAGMRRHVPTSTRADRLNACVSGMVSRQIENRPVQEWSLAELDEVIALRNMHNTRVEHFMTTDVFTVNEEELVELVACLMDWRRIRHVLVESENGKLVGLVTHRALLRYLSDPDTARREGTPVKEIMIREPVTVTSSTPTVQAIQKMRELKIGSLPVVQDDELVGIITETDFYHIAREILDDSMSIDDLASQG